MKRKKKFIIPSVNYTKVDYGIPVTDEQRQWLRANYPKYFKKRSVMAKYMDVNRYTLNLILLQEKIAKEA